MALSYKMDHDRRGKAIIISNAKFNNTKLNLPGYKCNVKYITDGLKPCGFDVHTHKNKTKDEIMSIAETVASEDKIHRDADCMVFCIMSHGSEDGICGIDYRNERDLIKIKDIVEPFKGDKCPSLAGKPKIFIINACRGSKKDVGVVNPMSVSMSASAHGTTIPNQPQLISTSADILIFTSSYPDYVSYTNHEEGSYFMKRLGDHLYNHGQVKPLREIFDMVKNDVASHRVNWEDKMIVFQMPQVEETLRKQIYFGTKRSKNCKSRNNVDNRLQSGMAAMMKEDDGNKLTKAEMTDRSQRVALNTKRYKMNHPKRGKAIIINNWHFASLDDLPGSDVDVKQIKRGLKHNRFDVEIYNDLRRGEIMDLVKSVASEDHSDEDCMVFCVNSHGSKKGICGTDYQAKGDAIDIQALVRGFIGKKCQSLVGKPKIFITNACAGTKEDHGVCVPQPEYIGNVLNYGFQPEPEQIPETADILNFNSSYPGYVSGYDPKKGAYFMERLGDLLYDHGQANELYAIFKKVQEDVAEHGTGHDFQMPQLSSTLLGEIYLGQQP